MAHFRYNLTGHWYKGNTHVHSTASDGGKTFAELAQFYAEAGYSFLFRTDHWVTSDACNDPHPYPLLWLNGMELDGRDRTGAEYHVVALGTTSGIHREMGLPAALEAAHAQNALLILAHPLWMGNTFEDALRWPFDGVEIYNHVCQWLNGKGVGLAYWNDRLKHIPNTLGLAADDAHANPGDPGLNRGWAVINAPECTREAVLAALRAGNFYSSTGPEIQDIQYDGQRIRVTCSPVQFVRLVGPSYAGTRAGSEDGAAITQAEFEAPANWPYVYLELEDTQGKLAWSNPLFVEE